MLRRLATAALRKSSIGCVRVRRSTRSWAPRRSVRNRRIERTGPSKASGGMTALTRDPSASRASTMGLDSSRRRPTALTIRSMICRRCRSSRKVTGTSSRRPSRSIYTWSWRLTKMSEMVGSASRASKGPRPNSSWSTSVISASRSKSVRGVVRVSASSIDMMSERISGSACSRWTAESRSRFSRERRSR